MSICPVHNELFSASPCFHFQRPPRLLLNESRSGAVRRKCHSSRHFIVDFFVQCTDDEVGYQTGFATDSSFSYDNSRH